MIGERKERKGERENGREERRGADRRTDNQAKADIYGHTEKQRHTKDTVAWTKQVAVARYKKVEKQGTDDR